MKEIELSQGYVAQVDDEDYARVSAHKWSATVYRNENGSVERVYAFNAIKRNGKRTTQKLHQFIMGVKGVDHWDHNGLNNQRYNLRLATGSQNQYNQRLNINSTSGFKGVCWYERYQKWLAYITVSRKRIYLGYFHDILDAARAYDAAALKYHGEFAMTNVMLGLLPKRRE